MKPRVRQEVVEGDLLVHIASLFYLQGLSQVAIAHQLGIDPSTVSRYLKRAREEKVIRVEIRRPQRLDVDLGRQLAERYGLSRAIVADGSTSLAPFAADYITGLLRTGMRIGVGWGQTLSAVFRHLDPGTVSGLRIAQLAGGLSHSVPGIQGHELVRQVAMLYPGSRVHYLHAPSIVDTASTQQALLAESSVQAALAAAAQSELALVGVGQMDESATMFRGGHVSQIDWAALVREGAAGSMNSRFFGRNGQPVDYLDTRTIAIGWPELAAIPYVVAVAEGLEKVDAIRGALLSQCVDSLATDAQTAMALIRAAN